MEYFTSTESFALALFRQINPDNPRIQGILDELREEVKEQALRILDERRKFKHHDQYGLMEASAKRLSKDIHGSTP